MSRPVKDHEILSAVFAKMDAVAMTVALGALCSLLLFLATAVLLVQASPDSYFVGEHLRDLSDYLPGYSVSWMGAGIGAGYGLLLGGIAGFLVAVYWNLTHYFALGVMLISSAELAD
ncbi:MAG: hypothetical protein P8J79_08595 [Halioglobus sp.]|nr:hypothetical protein [Halioglobus sp.]